jgi:hypothetical protein
MSDIWALLAKSFPYVIGGFTGGLIGLVAAVCSEPIGHFFGVQDSKNHNSSKAIKAL